MVNDGRTQRYAEVIIEAECDPAWAPLTYTNPPCAAALVARAVMAVADAEQAELRADRDRLAAENVLLPDQIAKLRAKLARVEAYLDGIDPPVTVRLLNEGFGYDEAASDFADGVRAALSGPEPEAEHASLIWSLDGRACPECREPNVHHAACPEAT